MRHINANGFSANHTSQEGNHIHERIFLLPAFHSGEVINANFEKDVSVAVRRQNLLILTRALCLTVSNPKFVFKL